MAATLIPDIDFLSIIETFKSKRILVVGDFILDVYVKGISTRLCPEAPVPVVDVTDRVELLGGGANTACNVATEWLHRNWVLPAKVPADERMAIALNLRL